MYLDLNCFFPQYIELSLEKIFFLCNHFVLVLQIYCTHFQQFRLLFNKLCISKKFYPLLFHIHIKLLFVIIKFIFRHVVFQVTMVKIRDKIGPSEKTRCGSSNTGQSRTYGTYDIPSHRVRSLESLIFIANRIISCHQLWSK